MTDEDLTKITDPLERARQIGVRIDELQERVVTLSQQRRDLLLGVINHGSVSQSDVARALGLTRSRLSQMLGMRSERRFLGDGRGPITVAIGGKTRPEEDTPDYVSRDSMAAYDILATLARDVGLEIQHEVVPPPGLVDLARDNLIVLTSPRLLPILGQVIGADPRHRFARDDSGWHLVDLAAGKEYRSSGARNGEPIDYAYVGRLPRTDGAGTFLYIAGIHGPGTRGGVAYVADHLPDLWREVRSRRWSVILEVRHEPDTGAIASVQRASTLWQEGAAE